jgi:hypothetical protein
VNGPKEAYLSPQRWLSHLRLGLYSRCVAWALEHFLGDRP